MATRDHAQTAFSGGALSPRLHGRFDVDLYKRSLASAENFEVLAHGPIRRRPGSAFLAQVGAGAPMLVPFRVSSGESFLLSIGDKTVDVYSAAGGTVPVTVVDPGTQGDLVVNGNFTDRGASWDALLDSGAIFNGADCQLPFGKSVVQKITMAAPRAVTLSVNVKALQLGNDAGHVLRVQIGMTPGGGQIFDNVNDLSDLYIATTGTKTWSVTFPAGTSYLTFHNASGVPWAAPGYVTIDDVSAIYSTDPQSSAITTPWSRTDLAQVRWAASPGQNRIVFVHPRYKPWYLERRSATLWTRGDIAFLNTPETWTGAAGAGNYPSVCEFFQGRLYFAATPSDANRIWATRPGTIADLTMKGVTSDPDLVTDSHAIDAQLSTKGAIRWLKGRQRLLVGTDIGEGSVSSQSGLIGPKDFQYREESAFGSASVQPVDVGDHVVYLSADRRKVRAISYAQAEDAWQSRDLTFIAEHLSSSDRIREIHFARDPNLTILGVLDSGKMIACTYNRAEQVTAWWQYTPGNFELAGTAGLNAVATAAVIHTDDGSLACVIARRASGYALEAVAFAETSSCRLPLDSAVSRPVTNRVAAGLAHLEGLLVGVVADGQIHSDCTVVGGQITLDTDASSVVVGIPFRARAVTLPPVAGERGANPRALRRWTKLFLRVNDSAMPLVNGERASARRPASTALTGYTGVVGVSGTAWETDGVLTIEQDLPLRTEILGVFGQLAENEV